MRDKLFKWLTMAMFISLIIGFVAYKSGVPFGARTSFSSSPNGGALIGITDTIPKVDSLRTIRTVPSIMHSSKVMIIREPRPQEKDYEISLKDYGITDSIMRIDSMSFYRESEIAIRIEALDQLLIDSLLIDTLER